MAPGVSRRADAPGCLALPLAAARWRRVRPAAAAAGRANLSWSHSTPGGVLRLRCVLDAPIGDAPDVVREVTSGLAGAMAAPGLVVGVVGVVPGEEPVLLALAPRRDVVAPLIVETLTAGEAHRRRRIWIGLAPGTYLATAVDPYVPFRGDADEVADLVGGGRAAYAICVGATTGSGRFRVALEAYGRRSELRKLLRTARSGRADGSRRAADR